MFINSYQFKKKGQIKYLFFMVSNIFEGCNLKTTIYVIKLLNMCNIYLASELATGRISTTISIVFVEILNDTSFWPNHAHALKGIITYPKQ